MFSSKVVAQSSVIVDKDSESDDDFVVKEQKLQDDQKLPLNGFGGEAGDDDDFDKNGLNKGEHGALVKKILESKEQLEHGSQLNNKKNDSVCFSYSSYILFSKTKCFIHFFCSKNRQCKWMPSVKKSAKEFKKKLIN